MMKVTRFFRQGSQPDMHRYAQATFHEGTHRMAPGDSTPWRDTSSPVDRIKGWWLAPAAKGSVIAAWCITIVLGTYCYSIQQDAKGTYLLNNVLLRNLHEESLRADANQQRASDLQEAIKAQMVAQNKNKLTTEKVKEFEDSLQQVKAGVVNYELELSRERARADSNHERAQNLVKELISVRQESANLRKDNKALVDEVERLRKELRRKS